MRNWFKFEILVAAIIPSIVKIADVRAVPTAIPNKCLLPETNPNINAMIVEIAIKAIVFERMYSDIFTGDTTIAFNTFGFFPKEQSPQKKQAHSCRVRVYHDRGNIRFSNTPARQ